MGLSLDIIHDKKLRCGLVHLVDPNLVTNDFVLVV
jgi:hypothetical protein